ncbi:MAG TPA: pyridoxamine 5'-phosphate oxidase family protein [Umezawaea sp.]|nr:pyridoxamine 5'-phosphate oxidase family protein [Umezawaea sp.]
MIDDESLAARTHRLLAEARYLSLATVSADGRPWVAVLEYAALTGPLRLLFGSATGSRHGTDVARSPEVSGALFLPGNGADFTAVDGAQFSGRCRALDSAEVDEYHAVFYAKVFPDEAQRAEWMLPAEALRGQAGHRLYLVEVDRWWLVDTRTWAEDRIDRRVEMPLDGFR